jgi:hypothetical protein
MKKILCIVCLLYGGVAKNGCLSDKQFKLKHL